MKYEAIEITVLGKEYKVLKPKAKDVIRLEFECSKNGNIDLVKLIEGYLKFISKKLKIEDFDKDDNNFLFERVNGEMLTIENFNTRKKLQIVSKAGNMEHGVDVITILEEIIKLSNEKPDIDEMSYAEIMDLMQIMELVGDNLEVLKVYEELKTFL